MIVSIARENSEDRFRAKIHLERGGPAVFITARKSGSVSRAKMEAEQVFGVLEWQSAGAGVGAEYEIYCRGEALTIPDFLTTTDAAGELGISPRRVRALISAGRLATTEVGGMHLIAPRDLDAVRDRKPGRPWPAAKPKRG